MAKQRTIAALLAAVVVLLAMNLLKGSTEAHAAQAAAGPTLTPVSVSADQVIGSNGSGASFWRVFRMWSDGSVDSTVVFYGGLGGCNIDSACTREVPITPCNADVTGDGMVNVLDLIELLLVFGVTCPS